MIESATGTGSIIGLLGFGLAILLGVVIPLVRWTNKATGTLSNVEMMCAELLKMHQEPGKTGFGTDRTNRLLENMAREQTMILHQMVHYLEWYVKEATGKTPPPYLPPHRNQ